MKRAVTASAAALNVPDTADGVTGLKAFVVEAKFIECLADRQAAGASADDGDLSIFHVAVYAAGLAGDMRQASVYEQLEQVQIAICVSCYWLSGWQL